MKKYNNQKGQDLIEYALMLAIVVGIGSFIYSGSGMGNSISNIFGNTSNLLGVVASASKDPSNLSSDDRNMKWLQETFMGYITKKWFQDQVGHSLTNRTEMDFTNAKDTAIGGLSDSESNSNFMSHFDWNELGDCSWVMTEYTKDGKPYYGVSIYDPSKNGGKKLSEQPTGSNNIITDVYHVDPNTGKVTQVASNVNQSVFKKTDKNGNTYNVIRGYKK